MLVLHGHSEFLFSKEAITQGDPLSMFIYAIGTFADGSNYGMLTKHLLVAC